jgi:hypothetical protein
VFISECCECGITRRCVPEDGTYAITDAYSEVPLVIFLSYKSMRINIKNNDLLISKLVR